MMILKGGDNGTETPAMSPLLEEGMCWMSLGPGLEMSGQ